MRDEPPPHHPHIDAAEIDRIDVGDDGRRLYLRVRDTRGRHASVSLPVDCVGTILTAVPHAPARNGAIHRVDGWSLQDTPGGLLLTLRLPDGAEIAFAVTSWQIEAMASLAGQGGRDHRRLN